MAREGRERMDEYGYNTSDCINGHSMGVNGLWYCDFRRLGNEVLENCALRMC
jgi:hypothetical protein